MNNSTMFTLGAALGAALGGVATYFFMKDRMEAQIADEINDYIQYVNRKRDREEVCENKEENADEQPAEEKKDEKIYKYYKGSLNDLETVRKDPEVVKEIEEVTEGDKAFEKNPKIADDPNIIEVDEIDKDMAATYSTEYLTFLWPQDELYYGYQTDNQELAESHFNVGREAIIGQVWRWATDYTNNESGTGTIYLINHRLQKNFEVTVIVDMALEDQYQPLDEE